MKLLPYYPTRYVPTHSLWQQLGQMHDLPWSLSLRVEVDGVLGDRVHRVVMRRHGRGAASITCTAAFRPLVGKQYVAWCFIQPDTLVYAVRTAGVTEATVPAAASHDASAAAAEEEVEQDEEEEEEEEEREGVEEEEREGVEEEEEEGVGEAGAMAQLPAPPLVPLPPQVHHANQVTIQVTA